MDYTTETYEDEGTFRTYVAEHVRAIVQELDDGSAYLERIDVDEEFRGQGIGTAAIREILGDFDAAAPLECLYYLDQGFGVYSVEL